MALSYSQQICWRAVYSELSLSAKRAISLCRSLLVLLLIVLTLGGGGKVASAKPPFVQVFTDAYHPKANGKLSEADCSVCHDAAPPKLNAYGVDIKAAMESVHSKNLTAAILHSIDTKDSDGDGFDNATEITADTLPGDPTSKPAGTPPPPKKPTTSASSDTKASDAGSSEPNPFDLKGLILPKHGQHPILVHFPVALFVISLLFDLLAFWRKDAGLAAAGYLNLTVAAITSPLTVISGFIAWQFAYGGISGASFKGLLQQHLITGIITTILIWALWGARFSKKGQSDRIVTVGYLALAIVTAALLSYTGHVGGFLSGVN